MLTNQKEKTYAHASFSAIIIMILTMLFLFKTASGNVYDYVKLNSSLGVISPYVILQNGTDNVSIIFTNQTSASILLNATPTPTTYSYALNITNKSNNPLNLTLQVKSGTNLDKINATILLHNGTHSEIQITINDGTANETNKSFLIEGNSTIFIEVQDLVENIEGPAYLYAYLKIDEYNASTYILYPITFKFS